MLTDDDLTSELAGAFRTATDHLGYAGRVPTPRTGPGLGVPLATTAAAGVALAATWALAPDPGSAPSTAAPSASPSASRTPIVTESIEVAGYRFSYRHAAGEERADDLHAQLHPGSVPDGATPIDAPDGARAWVGTDPTSGENGLYVEAPTRNGGQLFAILSPTWSTEELTDLFHHGEPQPVPAV